MLKVFLFSVIAVVFITEVAVLPADAGQVTKTPAQVLEVPRGTSLPFDIVANQIRQPITGNLTAEQFRVRLNAGGTLSLGGPDLVLGKPDFSSNQVFFMALDTLELKNGARIITNGNTLVIFVNHLISEDGGIFTFAPENARASNGGMGLAGSPGVPGRLVSLHVINDVTGIVHLDLSGQDGGTGGDGATGTPGQAGVKGDQSVSGVFSCAKGGGNGSPGSQGGSGGRAGDGGAGGAGGILELYNVGSVPISSSSYTFVAHAGRGGSGGQGGHGGSGGPGGDGGDGSAFCHGGWPGPNGAVGLPGPNGNLGATPNEGSAVVKNIDLNFILTTDIPKFAKAATGLAH